MAEPLPEPDPSLHWVGDEEPRRGRRQFELMLDWGLEPTFDVLEIGCGNGRLAYQLADYLDGGTYCGFDIAEAPIEWLQREYTSRRPTLRFDLLDVDNDRYRPAGAHAADEIPFPYDDAQFDHVCAHDVFAHMQQAAIEQYLRESNRVLRPGGRLLVTFMAIVDPDHPGVFADRQFVKVAEGTYTRFPERVGYSMAYTWEVIEAMVAGAGLDLDATVEGRWHTPNRKREGKVPAADLVVATKPSGVRPARWRVWRRSRP